MMLLLAIETELLKLRRTKITWILTLMYGIGPLMMSLMMTIVRNPKLAAEMGLVAKKAELTIGSADWPSYLAYTAIMFMIGIVVIGVTQAFVFGREYAEGTAKNMLTLPIGRATIVAAKIVVASLWYLAMAIIVYVEAILLGFLMDLPGYDAGLLRANVVLVGRIVGEVILVGSLSGWIAVLGRGYLAPVGLTILFLLLGDLFAHTGWGPWVPWSIVLLTSGAGGAGAPVPGPASTIVLGAFFIVCGLCTYLSLDRSDNTQ